jgi:hypothetical protein
VGAVLLSNYIIFLTQPGFQLQILFCGHRVASSFSYSPLCFSTAKSILELLPHTHQILISTSFRTGQTALLASFSLSFYRSFFCSAFQTLPGSYLLIILNIGKCAPLDLNHFKHSYTGHVGAKEDVEKKHLRAVSGRSTVPMTPTAPASFLTW